MSGKGRNSSHILSKSKAEEANLDEKKAKKRRKVEEAEAEKRHKMEEEVEAELAEEEAQFKKLSACATMTNIS